MYHGLIVYAPTIILVGAHVVRYAAGRIVVLSQPDMRARVTAWQMLTDSERRRMTEQAGAADVAAWLAAHHMAARDVPVGLRAPEWDYEVASTNPIPRPDFSALDAYLPPSLRPAR